MGIRKSERTMHLTPEEGLLGDLSKTGASLNLSEAPNRGTIFSLELKSKDLSVFVSAKIVHVKEIENGKFQAGIHFLNVTDGTNDKIEKMLDSYGCGVPVKAVVLKS